MNLWNALSGRADLADMLGAEPPTQFRILYQGSALPRSFAAPSVVRFLNTCGFGEDDAAALLHGEARCKQGVSIQLQPAESALG